MRDTTLTNEFARLTDAVIAGETPPTPEVLAADVAVARRLRATGDGMPDPAFKATLRASLIARYSADEPVRMAPLETPVGKIYLAYRGGTVLRVHVGGETNTFAGEVTALTGMPAEWEVTPPPELAERVLAHLRGEGRFTDIGLEMLKPFQRKVLEKTAEIPRGEVRSYAWIAREIGAPGAVRAVGTALGHNPLPLLIPCHRVLRTDGALGEYSGGGPEVKLRILTFEGVPVEQPAGRPPRVLMAASA